VAAQPKRFHGLFQMPGILRTYLPVPVLGTLPHRPGLAHGAVEPRELVDWISRLDPRFLHWLRV
jgi:hypothetical protein